MKEQAPGGPDKCVCPDCDYEMDKERGTPCRSMECPECGAGLVAGLPAQAGTQEEAEMPMTDVRQIAASAIETALAVVKGTGEITAERAERLLYALEADLGRQSGIPVAEVATLVTEFVLVPDGEWTATDLLEALTKKVSGRTHVKGDFLVAEDPKKVTTWSLPVKVNSKVNHRLMGAAKAALTVGYRGNKYEGPGKAAAIKKLKALYKAEDMEWTVSEAAMGEVGSGLESFTSQVRSAFQAVFRRKEAYSNAVPEPYLWVKDIFFEHPDLGNAVIVDKDGALLMVDYTQDEEGHFTFAAPEDWEQVKQTYVKVGVAAAETAELSERASFGEIGRGHAVNFVEAQGDTPAYIDFIPVSPGWGNKKNNHYYDLQMLREYADVWRGAKMWPSDHKREEKNALNQVTEVIESPVDYTDDGVPIARAVILSAAFEDMAHRRQEAGILHTLENSILAKGTTRKKLFEKDGRKGKYVESIDEENANIDWVTKAGAGGHATKLVEDSEGGGMMTEQGQASDAETKAKTEPVEEATLVEGEQGEEIALLAEKDVNEALAETNLPPFVKTALAAVAYADTDTLQTAIAEAIAEVKKLSGSGQVFGQGQTEPVAGATPEEREQAQVVRFNTVMREVGLREISGEV